MKNRITEIEAQMRSKLAIARGIMTKAQENGVSLEDDVKVKSILSEVEDLQTERRSLLAAQKNEDEIKADIHAGSDRPGFRKLAKALVKGDKAYSGKLDDFLGKTVTATDTQDASGGTTTKRIPGIQSLTEDLRSVSGAIPSQGAGNELHVQEFRISARTPSGSVERDPVATSAKATLAVTVTEETADFKQFALIADGLPNALLKAEPALETALKASLGREIRQALDSYALSQIEATAVYPNAAVLAASGIPAKVRAAMVQLAGQGGTATHAILNDNDLAALDVVVEASQVTKFPFGLTLIGTPDVLTGDGVVFDASGVAFYRGTVDVAADPYAGVDGNNFTKNLVDIRSEVTALLWVREPAKTVKLDASFTT